MNATTFFVPAAVEEDFFTLDLSFEEVGSDGAAPASSSTVSIFLGRPRFPVEVFAFVLFVDDDADEAVDRVDERADEVVDVVEALGSTCAFAALLVRYLLGSSISVMFGFVVRLLV